MAAPEGLPARAAKDVGKYLLDGEEAVVATRRHWAVLIGPTARFLPVFLVGGWLLAEEPRLLDLRERIYPDLPLGPASEHLLPGR